MSGVTNGMKLDLIAPETVYCSGVSRETCSRTLARHEFGHALGFAHEQDRRDWVDPPLCSPVRVDYEDAGEVMKKVGDSPDLNSAMSYCRSNYNAPLTGTDIWGVGESYGYRNPLVVISSGIYGPQRIGVFHTGTDRALYWRNWNGSAWTTTFLGGILTSAPAAAGYYSSSSGLFTGAAFGRGTTGHVHVTEATNGTFSGFVDIGAPGDATVLGSLGAAVYESYDGLTKSYIVFARGENDHLYFKKKGAAGWSTGGAGWVDMGGPFVGQISVTKTSTVDITVFVRGRDASTLLWSKYTSLPNGGADTWTALASAGGGLTSSPGSCVGNYYNSAAVYVRGMDMALYSNRFTASSNSWLGWEPLGGTILSNPAASPERNAGFEDVFVRGIGGTLWRRRYDYASGWDAGWASADAGVAHLSTPGVGPFDVARVDVFVRAASDSSLKHRVWNSYAYGAGAWTPSNGWEPLGGAIR